MGCSLTLKGLSGSVNNLCWQVAAQIAPSMLGLAVGTVVQTPERGSSHSHSLSVISIKLWVDRTVIYSHWLLRSTLPYPPLPSPPLHSPYLPYSPSLCSPSLSLHSPSLPFTSPHPVLMAIISTRGFFLILGILKGAPPNLRPPTRRAPKRRTVWPAEVMSTMIVQNGAAVP